MDGHRKCGVCLEPEESLKLDNLCPVCHKPLTLGVLYRVSQLADRTLKEKPQHIDPFHNLVPLPEILSEVLKTGPSSKKVESYYESIIKKCGNELTLLQDYPLEDIEKASSPLLSEAISRLRQGQVIRKAGFDGEYGVIRLFEEKELQDKLHPSLFSGEAIVSDKKIIAKKNPAHPQVIAQNKKPKASEASSTQVVLDEKQKQAVEHQEGPLLVVAGPGSGKTRTLTHRIAQLIEKGLAKPEQCLTLTFTRRAAKEMLSRLEKLLGKEADKIPVTTFHGLSFKILEENRLELGLPRGFRVASLEERMEYLEEKLKIKRTKAKKLIEKIATAKSQHKNGEKDPELAQAQLALKDLRDTQGLLDYEDLIDLSQQLLSKDERLQQYYQNRYPWISVDEFQDLDPAQHALLKLLVPKAGNLFAIGDPQQSIYGFRGSSLEAFFNFNEDFEGAQTITLDKNYRSSTEIVQASQQVMEKNCSQSLAKVQAIRGHGSLLQIHEAKTEKSEAEWIVIQIEKLLGGASFFALDSGRTEGHALSELSFSDIAILYRQESLSEAIEVALSRAGFPYLKHSTRPLSEEASLKPLLKILKQQEAASLSLKEAWESLKKSHETTHPGLLKLQTLIQEDWKNFWREVSLDQDLDTLDPRSDYIRLLTLHAAKGLEFKAVFILG
ncbi:MAG: UvrD-helicase domain-containing protein, partial [Deltaproteobacteria bacterium]|nr:UvrD-helicase domain-containing protein [Deltaproteobacteria bacterium]